MKKWVFIFCFLLIGNLDAKLFDAQELYLENGLRVIVVPNHKAPIIKQMLWYNVGSSDEALGQGGTAHLLEHLMFRGTSKVKGQKLNQLMEENGIESNAFTSQDATSYHEFMDISKLELAMSLEADRMQNLSLNQKDFELERDIVWQERKQVIENNPLSIFSETFNRSFWQNHPYSRPITGEADEIKNLQLEDVKNFYKTYYAPNNATLVLVGDIKPEHAFDLAQKYFGKIKPSSTLAEKSFSFDYKNNAKFEMNLAKIKTPRFIKSFLAPKNSYALEIFAKYLADGKTSFLYKKMVVADKTALFVSCSYNGLAKYGSSFSISITPTKKFDITSLLQEAIEQLDEQTLEQTKKKMLAGLVLIKDNPETEAYIVGALALGGLSLSEIENYEDNIKKTTLAEVKNAVIEMFKNNSLQGELQ